MHSLRCSAYPHQPYIWLPCTCYQNTLTYSEEKCEMAAVPFGWEECLQFLLKCIIFSLPLVLETGLVTPLGIGVENVWQKLISGMCGITRIINEGVIYNDVFIVSSTWTSSYFTIKQIVSHSLNDPSFYFISILFSSFLLFSSLVFIADYKGIPAQIGNLSHLCNLHWCIDFSH